jgi:hypothetical protein
MFAAHAGRARAEANDIEGNPDVGGTTLSAAGEGVSADVGLPVPPESPPQPNVKTKLTDTNSAFFMLFISLVKADSREVA